MSLSFVRLLLLSTCWATDAHLRHHSRHLVEQVVRGTVTLAGGVGLDGTRYGGPTAGASVRTLDLLRAAVLNATTAADPNIELEPAMVGLSLIAIDWPRNATLRAARYALKVSFEADHLSYHQVGVALRGDAWAQALQSAVIEHDIGCAHVHVQAQSQPRPLSAANTVGNSSVAGARATTGDMQGSHPACRPLVSLMLQQDVVELLDEDPAEQAGMSAITMIAGVGCLAAVLAAAGLCRRRRRAAAASSPASSTPYPDSADAGTAGPVGTHGTSGVEMALDGVDDVGHDVLVESDGPNEKFSKDELEQASTMYASRPAVHLYGWLLLEARKSATGAHTDDTRTGTDGIGDKGLVRSFVPHFCCALSTTPLWCFWRDEDFTVLGLAIDVRDVVSVERCTRRGMPIGTDGLEISVRVQTEYSLGPFSVARHSTQQFVVAVGGGTAVRWAAMLFRLQTIAAGLDGSDGGGGGRGAAIGMVGGPLGPAAAMLKDALSPRSPRRSMTPPAEEVHTYAQEIRQSLAQPQDRGQRQAPGQAQSGVDESEQGMQDVPVALPRRRSHSNSTARLLEILGRDPEGEPAQRALLQGLVSSQSGWLHVAVPGVHAFRRVYAEFRAGTSALLVYREQPPVRSALPAPPRARFPPMVPAVKGDRKKNDSTGGAEDTETVRKAARKEVRAQWRQWHTTRLEKLTPELLYSVVDLLLLRGVSTCSPTSVGLRPDAAPAETQLIELKLMPQQQFQSQVRPQSQQQPQSPRQPTQHMRTVLLAAPLAAHADWLAALSKRADANAVTFGWERRRQAESCGGELGLGPVQVSGRSRLFLQRRSKSPESRESPSTLRAAAHDEVRDHPPISFSSAAKPSAAGDSATRSPQRRPSPRKLNEGGKIVML